MSEEQKTSASSRYDQRVKRWTKKYESLKRRAELCNEADRGWFMMKLGSYVEYKPYRLELLYLLEMDIDDMDVPELPSEPQA